MLDEVVLAEALESFLHTFMFGGVGELENRRQDRDVDGTNMQVPWIMKPSTMHHSAPRSATTKSQKAQSSRTSCSSW